MSSDKKYGRLFLEVRKEQHYSGPLQPSREASAWNELVDGSAKRSFILYERQEIQRIEASDRILAIAEKKFHFDCEMEQKRHDDTVDIAKSTIMINTDIVKRGQLIGSVGALLIGAIAFYLIHEGNSGWGIAIVIAEIVAFAGVFVIQQRSLSNRIPQNNSYSSESLMPSDLLDSDN